MKTIIARRWTLLLLPWVMLSQVRAASPAPAAPTPAEAGLATTVAALDAKVFDAYNHCDMQVFGAYFTPDVEFYHDKSGVMRSRDEVVASTRKWICGKVRRELVAGSLEVYPIKDYGAIETGEHRFCQLDTGKCEGAAKFLMIWQLKDGAWQMTRVISYDHHATS